MTHLMSKMYFPLLPCPLWTKQTFRIQAMMKFTGKKKCLFSNISLLIASRLRPGSMYTSLSITLQNLTDWFLHDFLLFSSSCVWNAIASEQNNLMSQCNTKQTHRHKEQLCKISASYNTFRRYLWKHNMLQESVS